MSDLTLVPLRELLDEIERRHSDYVLVVAENPDDPEHNRAWWNGKVSNILWMLHQAEASLLCKFPLHECDGPNSHTTAL